MALPASRFLARRKWLSPDQVTLFALASGLAAGIPFAAGTRAGLVAGAGLFYVAFILDCIDGKLARALQVTSPRGEALDRLADGGRRASASLGLVLHLWRTDRPSVLWAVVYAVLAYYFLEISGAKRGAAAQGVGGRISAALARRRLLPNPGMPDVQAVVFVFGPLLGAVVVGLGVGIAMVLAAILLTVVRRLRSDG